MQAVILAGGLATRLGDLTKSRPKSMVTVLNKPFLAYQLEFLSRGGINNVVMCLGYMWQQIEHYFSDAAKYDVNIKFSIEDEPLGTAGALKRAEELLDDIFFTLYGDSYLFLDFPAVMRYFRTQNRLAMMTVYKNQDRYGRSNTAIEGNLVKKFCKKNRTDDMVFIEYGADIFRKEVLNMIPDNRFYSLEDLFPRLIEKEELLAYEVKGRFYEIGSPQGLAEFECYLKGTNDSFQSTS